MILHLSVVLSLLQGYSKPNQTSKINIAKLKRYPGEVRGLMYLKYTPGGVESKKWPQNVFLVTERAVMVM